MLVSAIQQPDSDQAVSQHVDELLEEIPTPASVHVGTTRVDTGHRIRLPVLSLAEGRTPRTRNCGWQTTGRVGGIRHGA